MDFTVIKYSGQGSFKVKKGTIDKLLFFTKDHRHCQLSFMIKRNSPVENHYDLELSLLNLVAQALYLMNLTDVTLASLSVFEILKWRPRCPPVMLLSHI